MFKLSKPLPTSQWSPTEVPDTLQLVSEGCGKKRCEVCVNICNTDTFSGTVTGKTFTINHKLNCDDKCLIYLFTCEYFRNLLEKTTEGFRSRWNNYKCNDRKYNRNENCFQEHLFKHFHCRKHTGFLENVKITLINKTDGQNHKKREDYWRKTLKTYAPFGFNVEDSV